MDKNVIETQIMFIKLQYLTISVKIIHFNYEKYPSLLGV